MIPVADDEARNRIESISQLLLTEINVKNLKLVNDGEGALVKRVKPDFKKLGPKFGKQMKAAAKAINELSQADIASLERNGYLEIELDAAKHRVEISDVEIFSEDIEGWLVANDGPLTVALDITITDELRREGIARDIINRIQNIRKDRDYDITDRITITFAPDATVEAVLKDFGEYIGTQVLADAVDVAAFAEDAAGTEILEIDELKVKVLIIKN